MSTLAVTLDPSATARFHGALSCLGKSSEHVTIEATRTKLVLSALNSSKTSFSSFTLDSRNFFQRYSIATPRDGREPQFKGRIYTKALLSVFKGRVLETKEKDTGIERCELSVEDGNQKAECRLIVKMVCKHGVLKTYKLTYESTDVIHAVFDRTAANNTWRIASRILKEFIEHFAPKTEQLDIGHDYGKVTFMSYTERVANGNEVLKQPLQTSIAVDVAEFEFIHVEEKHHIAISVKDFKAIVTHADMVDASITVRYSRPTRPMQLSYDVGGMLCEFTVMTIRDSKIGSDGPKTLSGVLARTEPMAPPPALRKPSVPTERLRRPSPPPPQPSMDPTSLFVSDDEADVWQDNWDDEEEVVGWDASLNPDSLSSSTRRAQDLFKTRETVEDVDERIAPTQHISQIRGVLFD